MLLLTAGALLAGSVALALSYGVYLGRFRRGVWCWLPAPLASELKRLSAGLEPLRFTPKALSRSR